MPNITLTRGVRSIRIFPTRSAEFNYGKTEMEVEYGDAIPLPKVFTKIGWESIKSSPKQSDGFSGAIPVVDSNGVHGRITFNLAAAEKLSTYDRDSVAIDRFLKESSTNLLPNHPYFKVEVTQDDGRLYTVICGMSITKTSQKTKLWKVTLTPNRVLDEDLTISDITNSINRLNVVAISPAQVKVTFYTNKPSTGKLYYNPNGSESLGSVPRHTSNGGYQHTMVANIFATATEMYFRCEAEALDGTGSVSTEIRKFIKGANTEPLALTNPTFAHDGILNTGRAIVRWHTDRPATSVVQCDGSNPPIESFSDNTLKQDHEVEVFFSTLLTDIFVKTYSIDKDGYSGRSAVKKIKILAETPPAVSNISVVSKTNSEIVVKFSTDVECTSYVEFGISKGYGEVTTPTATPTFTHEATITGLGDATKYYLRAVGVTPAPDSQTGYSKERAVVTAKVPAPSVTHKTVLGTPDPNIKVVNFLSNVDARFRVQHSDDPNFNTLFETPRSDNYTTNHSATVDITGYSDSSLIYFRVLLDNQNGVEDFSEVFKIVKTTNTAGITVESVFLDSLTYTQAEFKVRLSTSASIVLTYSKDESMLDPETFALQSTAVSHVISGSISGRGSGVDVWYTVSVIVEGATVFRTIPEKFTTPNALTPEVSNVTVETRSGQSDIVVVKATTNVPIIGRVNWGLEGDDLGRYVDGPNTFKTEHSIEVNIDRDIPSDTTIYLQIGGAGKLGIINYSVTESYNFTRGLTALLIEGIRNRNWYTADKRRISWTTSEPSTGVVFYGVEGDINSQVSSKELSVDHTVLVDVANFDEGDEYRFKIQAETVGGKVDITPEEVSDKLNDGKDGSVIFNIDTTEYDEYGFLLQCNTSEVGQILIRATKGGATFETALTGVDTTLHTIALSSAVVGTTITYTVKFYPADGGAMVESASYVTPTLPTTRVSRLLSLDVRKHSTYVNTALVVTDSAVGGRLELDIGTGPEGFIGPIVNEEQSSSDSNCEIGLVPAEDMLKKGFIYVRARADSTGTSVKDTSSTKIASLGKSTNAAKMVANIIGNVNISYENPVLRVSWSNGVNPASDMFKNHVLYSTEGSANILDSRVYSSVQTNTPSLDIDTSGIASGTWVYLRVVSGSPGAAGGGVYRWDWHFGELLLWRKP